MKRAVDREEILGIMNFSVKDFPKENIFKFINVLIYPKHSDIKYIFKFINI